MARLSSASSRNKMKKKATRASSMTGFTTMVQHHRRLVVRVVAIGVGGLLCLFLSVTVLFSIVSIKASHQLSSSSSRRIIPAGPNNQNQKNDTTTTTTTTTTTVLLQNQENNRKVQNKQKQHPPIVSTDVIQMCARTLWHTMSTTTIVLPNDQTFIHTGDIDDLWLRDSAAQVHPLLLPLVPYYDHHDDQDETTTNNTSSSASLPARYVALVYDDPNLDRVVAGLIRRQALYIRHDPYANAFRIDDSYVFSPAQKLLGRHDLISTWNYELDSGCYYLRLLYYYWRAARTDQSAAVLNHPTVREAVYIMIDLWIAEQRHEDDAFPTGSLLDCQNCGRPYRYPGLARDGKGTPTNASSGLTWTGFRPSDDECHYHFLIPANMMCVTVLEYVMELALVVWHDEQLSTRARSLQREILRGIQEHAIVHHPTYGAMYAYEVDGLGNYLLMDDANIPSLLSLPYLQYPYLDHDIYANTKRFILSSDNPYYASGTNPLTGRIAGVGSPHMAQRIRHNIWPMSLAVEGIMTKDPILAEQLVRAAGGGRNGWMHESFDVANPNIFTRAWFCWADALFGELALTLLKETNDVHLCLDMQNYTILEWRDPVPPVPSRRFAAATTTTAAIAAAQKQARASP